MAATLTLESMPRFQTRQALVLLNLQTDFVTAEGKLHAPHPPDCVDRIKKLVPAFRDAGDVIWVRTEFETERAVNDAEGQAESVVTDDDLPAHEREEEEEEEEEEEAPVVEATPDSPVHEPERTSTQPRSVSAPIRETFLSSTGSNREGGPVRCCERDTAGAAFAPAVVDCVRETGDSTFITSYYSAFNSTDLLSFLRGNFVTELYVCGAISNISVYATALDAVRHGYSVTLVHDCMAYRSEARHNEAVRQMTEFMGADLVTSDEFARSLREDRPSASGPGTAIEADKDVFDVVEVGKASRLKPIETRSTDSAIALADDPSEAPAAPSATGKNSRAGSVTRRTSSRDVERPLEVRPHALPKAADAPRPPLGRGASQPRSKTWPDPEVPGRGPSKDHDDDDDDDDGDATSTDVTKATASEASEASPTTPTAATAATAATAERGRGSSAQPTPRVRVARRIEMRSTPPPPPLGPDSKVGEGDSRIVHDILPARLRHGIFERLQDEVRFRPMYHRGGEVPRLVAAQGEIAEEGSIPVYRHPADESPPPSRFSHVVADIRDVVQKTLGHPINHVLIQRYRNGQDHITEHSDKTLDIVRGSSIANVSFGAQRTMVLRTKRSAFGPRPPSLPDRVASDGNVGNPENAGNAGNAGRSAGRRAEQSAARSRRSQRVPMPHNSMFVLGPKTNTSWLHGIRPDRRPPTEKLEHELAYAGERISLTFRHVGTFLNPRTNRIWGQGAKSKRKEDAGAVVDGGGVESERMVNAFGRENQETDFDWDDAYGEGFDVVDVVATRPRLFLSRHRLSNVQVRLHLAELDVEYDERQPVPLDGTTSSPRLPSRPPTDEEDGAIRFVDRDVERAESVGVLPVIFYLERYYRDGGGGGGDGSNGATVKSPSSSSSSSYTRSEMATILTRSGLTHQLILCWERFGQVTTLPRPSSSSSSTFSSSTSTSTSSTMASSSFSSTSSTNADRVAAEKALHRELATWEDRASHYAHIGCHAYSVADSAFWPVLDDIVRKWADWDHHIFANLHRYHVALLARPAVRKVLRLAEAREVLHDAGPAVDKA